jgi:4-amino-4-deoxy-L-arabinose transferase-like glycosyltransferase
MASQQLSKNYFLFFLGLIICLNITCLFNEVMEPDGTLYAGLAKQIVKSGNWFSLFINGADWLDKPHLPFWLAAASFKIFGISAFSYKLPSFIFFMVSLFYCFKLSAAIYSKEIARLTVLIYGSTLHIIISNFDGKVEIYLAAFATASICHLYFATGKKWFWHIALAALFAACAVMTKGIFALVTIGAGFVIYWAVTKQWKQFINLKWYLFVLLSFIFIFPELYSLYVQFDLHPEKTVFGKTGVSGIRFFFWDSQFGRFFNNGPIKGKGDLSFFIHTTLWAFIPWCVALVLAVVKLFRLKKPIQNNTRWIIGGSAAVSFLMFSLSKFQLPHYILILFPHFSMMTAAFLCESASEKAIKKINVFQTVLFALAVAFVIGMIVFFVFDSYTWLLVFTGIIAAFTFFYKTGSPFTAVIKKNIAFAVVTAVFLNCLFYPALLQYQGGMMAGKWLNKQPQQPVISLYKSLSSGFDFYYNGTIDYTEITANKVYSAPPANSLLLFTKLNDLKDFSTDSVEIQVIKTFQNFHVSQVNGKFINHNTRYQVLDTFAIVSIRAKQLNAKQ